MFTEKAIPICVLQILQQYSDEEHILTMKEIQSKLKNIYYLEPDRRTVSGTIKLLIETGYDISDYNENHKGYYLVSRELEPSEIRVLMDAVYSFPFIEKAHSDTLIKKLRGLGSEYESMKYINSHLTVYRQEQKTQNKQVFLNIEQIDDAIGRKKKISVRYMTYNENKELVLRRQEPYILNPFGMIYTNERYYLVCNYDKYDNISLYRIDRMKDIKVLEDGIDAKKVTAGEVEEALNNAVYAFTGKAEKIIFAFDRIVLNDVIDRFKADIWIYKEKGTDRLMGKITAPTAGIRLWALQYLPYVEIMEPKQLREEIIGAMKRNRYGIKCE